LIKIKVNVELVIFVIFVISISACHPILKGKSDVNNPMVLIPAGKFTMGYVPIDEDDWGDRDEEPVHEVYLSSFWIDKYETTALDFSKFLNENLDKADRFIRVGKATTIKFIKGKYNPRMGMERLPANGISWYGADAYCRSIKKRLPTEAEWEKAARGIDQRVFPWGNSFPNPEWITFRRKFSKLGFKVFSPIDEMEKGQSPYGVYHLAGNVWEWVSDWYEDVYYENSPENDPQGPDSGESRVLRGGNWYYKAYYLRSVYRYNDKPESLKVWQGVRCSKSGK
jgi:formylglycine-generating enzyme required for sulfatase activity